jgi:hypothetical protein
MGKTPGCYGPAYSVQIGPSNCTEAPDWVGFTRICPDENGSLGDGLRAFEIEKGLGFATI